MSSSSPQVSALKFQQRRKEKSERAEYRQKRRQRAIELKIYNSGVEKQGDEMLGLTVIN